jgi:phosphoglycolate phosphatase
MTDAQSLTSVCNICGGSDWKDINMRAAVFCGTCGSYERTRAMKLVLDSLDRPQPGDRILHFAPEKGLSDWFSKTCGVGYEPADIDPSIYPHARVRQFDLVTDTASLPSNSYDLVVHNHVLEHIPCSLAHVLFHLHRALTPRGKHVFSVPIMSGCYEEDFGELTHENATKRFGQFDHVRRFGRDDMDRHLGQLLDVDLNYNLYAYRSRSELEACNIPEIYRTGLHSCTIFVAGKYDYKLANLA